MALTKKQEKDIRGALKKDPDLGARTYNSQYNKKVKESAFTYFKSRLNKFDKDVPESRNKLNNSKGRLYLSLFEMEIGNDSIEHIEDFTKELNKHLKLNLEIKELKNGIEIRRATKKGGK